MGFYGEIAFREDNNSLFSDFTIYVSKISTCFSSWDDDVGEALLGSAQKAIANYNSNLGNYFDFINQMNNFLNSLNSDEFQYESRQSEIERMKV